MAYQLAGQRRPVDDDELVVEGAADEQFASHRIQMALVQAGVEIARRTPGQALEHQVSNNRVRVDIEGENGEAAARDVPLA